MQRKYFPNFKAIIKSAKHNYAHDIHRNNGSDNWFYTGLRMASWEANMSVNSFIFLVQRKVNGVYEKYIVSIKVNVGREELVIGTFESRILTTNKKYINGVWDRDLQEAINVLKSLENQTTRLQLQKKKKKKLEEQEKIDKFNQKYLLQKLEG